MVSLPVEDPFAAYPSLPNPLSVAQTLAHPLSDSGDESDEAPASQPVRTVHNGTPESVPPGGDGGVIELALPADDLSEEALLRLALELSMQEAQPEIAREGGASVDPPGVATDVDEPSAACESLKETEQHLVEGKPLQPDESSGKEGEPVRRGERGVSRSQARFRTMLLDSFADDVTWMRTCSGLEAVPVLQLLARLASERAPSGAIGLDGFDVRKVVVAMLGELDLGVPLSVENRSEWGEVAILTLKFFAFVLGDWEGADEEPGAHRSADAEAHRKHGQSNAGRTSDGPKKELRQQALLDYLLSILQRLVPEFAKAKREKTGPPDHQGALLHWRHDKPLSSLRPFFPDSYTRAHGRDVFAEFPKLMLGVALDLAEALTESGLKPDGSGFTERKEDVPKGSWVDVLCSYIYCPQTHFVRDSARHVLLQACGGSKAAYNLARDVWLLGKEIQQLQRLSEKSDAFRQSLSHDKSVKLVKCLGVLAESAEKRPDSWQWFCSMEKHADALGFLLRASYFFREEAALQALKLLALAFAEGKDEGRPPSARPSADVLLGEPAELTRFVRFFLLDFGAKAVRAQARAVLQNACLRAESESEKHALLAVVVDAVPQLSSYGSNVQEVSGLLKWILRKSAGPLSGVSAKALEALRAHNRLLETHPNSRAYSMLQSLIEFDGYYLESEPCTACSNVEVPYSKLKLESIKQETKYTDNRILVRCPSSYAVGSFSMNVHDARRSKSVKVLRLYYNNRAATDLSELKSNWGLWKKVKSYHLAPNQGELKAELTAPVTGCNFMFEFAELYENLQASSLEHLQVGACAFL
jgi:E3 ubiquitin-protein ligase UBR4